jgi:lipoprotein-anchoring transpeptidase ErfK/SrfK
MEDHCGVPAVKELQSGVGVPGGPENPLGARALYLWQGNKDSCTGSIEPWTIGQNISAGCIRMTNDDIIDLYDHTAIGAKVIVLAPTSCICASATYRLGLTWRAGEAQD